MLVNLKREKSILSVRKRFSRLKDLSELSVKGNQIFETGLRQKLRALQIQGHLKRRKSYIFFYEKRKKPILPLYIIIFQYININNTYLKTKIKIYTMLLIRITIYIDTQKYM